MAALTEQATDDEIRTVTCAQLRARNAVWRADGPIIANRIERAKELQQSMI
jgi:hypothetical protein